MTALAATNMQGSTCVGPLLKAVHMIIRQSSIKQWQECPLRFRYTHIDGLEREQSGAVVFGSIIHDCVLFLETAKDLDATVERFEKFWANPELLDPEYRIDYYVRGTNWKKYLDSGRDILRRWWSIIQWDSDLTIAREHFFEVPIGNGHTLQGTVDKVVIRWNSKLNTNVLLISDYKTNKKTPTYDYLEEDLQFSSYAYASLQPEFWDSLPNGKEMYERYKDLPRHGEWVSLTNARRMDAGERTPRHYNRLIMQVDAMAESIAANIFTLNISGEACRYCDFRKQCGLPEIEDPD